MKRLALIGGSLEPGRDGVGDFIGQLAEAAQSRGIVVTRLGLADGADLDTPGLLRLDRRVSWSERRRMAENHLREFAPDWISWHLVPYAWNPKGVIPAGLDSLAHAGTPAPRRHLFLHELWIGEEAGANWRHRLWRIPQRMRLLRFLRRWQPDRVDTSNEAYRTMLAAAGWKAGVVPLFGNVPVAAPKDHPDERTPTASDPDRPLVAAFFGTLHPAWDPHPTTRFLQAAATASGRPVHCLGLGRIGAHGERWLAGLGHPLRGSTSGELPADQISQALQAADFGVATHPWALLGKSGAVAAYLDHGLPVLAPRDDWHLGRGSPAIPAPGPGCAKMCDLAPATFAQWLTSHRRPPQPRRDAIVERWLASLEDLPA